jgi:hypothetical protein
VIETRVRTLWLMTAVLLDQDQPNANVLRTYDMEQPKNVFRTVDKFYNQNSCYFVVVLALKNRRCSLQLIALLLP